MDSPTKVTQFFYSHAGKIILRNCGVSPQTIERLALSGRKSELLYKNHNCPVNVMMARSIILALKQILPAVIIIQKRIP
jgi:hypothetical protein